MKDNLEDVIAASKSASVVVFDILDNPDVAKEVIQGIKYDFIICFIFVYIIVSDDYI